MKEYTFIQDKLFRALYITASCSAQNSPFNRVTIYLEVELGITIEALVLRDGIDTFTVVPESSRILLAEV